MKKPVIQFKDFTFQYFSQAAPTIKNINLTIYEGEKVLIVGPSGSGKSTLGNCLNGLIPFAHKGEISGSLTINGIETKDSSIFDLSKHIGTVLQDSDGQFIGLTVAEDIAFTLENNCVDQKEMHKIVKDTAALVEMEGLLNYSPFELSGGQKQRVAMAGVMVDDVDILLFDEPLANLDPSAGKSTIDLIDRIQQEMNKTVIVIEHRLEDVLYRDVDRIILVAEGCIVADMTPNELMAADILPKYGIREPLYLTAMRYAGIEITPQIRPGHLSTLDITSIKDRLLAWNEHFKANTLIEEKKELLTIKDLEVQYSKKRPILNDINLSIKEGEMVSIVGTNGAGKSTLAKAICGFIKPQKGELYFAGESMEGLTIKERADKIGYVMQNPNQMICKSMIYEEVALGLKVRGYEEEEIKTRVDKALEICGLSPFKSWPINALSFGQKKRVTIASILAMNPKMLILDEPTAGQDYHHYTEIMEFLKSLNEQGVTIVMITHDMHLMLEYTPHVIVISNGTKIADSTAVDVLTNKEIVDKASLKLTSLYELALAIGIEKPDEFVENFISFERKEKLDEK